MGWNWRKAFNFGPLRVNLSKKGVAYSVGVRGFRVGRDAKGQDYCQTSVRLSEHRFPAVIGLQQVGTEMYVSSTARLLLTSLRGPATDQR